MLNVILLHCVSTKDPQHYRLQLEERLSDLNTFWYIYSGHNWSSNDYSISHLIQCAFALPGKHRTSKIRVEMNKKYKKKHPDIIDCNLKKDYKIFTIFGTNISDTTGHKTTVHVPTSPNICFCTTWRKQNKINITFFETQFLWAVVAAAVNTIG